MCGIYGMIALGSSALRCPQLLGQMGSSLRHRGPDGCGTLVTPDVALGAMRLRIVDPSPAGDQPFHNASAGVVLVCNGEIYNAPDLRSRYASYDYRSHSDVEPILPLYLEKGAAGLADLEGMFALAIYDFRRKRLLLARDPAGEKPLFYAHTGHEIWFASEVQALLHSGGASRCIDRQAAYDLLNLGYVREPKTMFADIRKIEAGTVHTFGTDSCVKVTYWNPQGTSDTADTAGVLDELATAVEQAVAKQTLTDGPVGIFASGGVDSALLATHAVTALGRERVRLFTVGFVDRSFDESVRAARLARRLGTEHTVVRADDESLTSALTTIVRGVAEPITDPAVLPTYLLAREARRHTKVVLSGEGADELFGGYPTYLGHRGSAWYARLPSPVRRKLAEVVGRVPVRHRKVSLEFLLKQFVAHAGAPLPERHVSWFGTGIPREAFSDGASWWTDSLRFPDGSDSVQRASLFDYETYLRENLLVKIDRATMLCSLEARAPYLDPAVIRIGLALDPKLKVRGFTTKWALKRVAGRVVPMQFVRRTKRGLSVPVARWLNTTLGEDVDRLLSPERLGRHGLLRADPVCQLLSEHRSGRANHARPLWSLLMFQYWLDYWGSEDCR